MKECVNCGAAMREAQDWCVQCGAAQPGRLGRGPGWLTGAAILAAMALLVVGASVAAYAALNKHKPEPSRTSVALRTPTSTVAPGTAPTVPGGATPTTPTTPGASTAPRLPTGTAPPKIPTQTPTPKGSNGGGGQSANSLLFPPETGKGTKSSKSSKATKSGGSSKANKSGGSSKKGATEGVSEGGGGEGSSSESGSSKGSGSKAGSSNGSEPPAPILLDTNAASTYNPNAYPSSLFGDPSLAIDGEASTAWTASLEAASAPKMAVGIVLDLKTAQKLGSATVKTTTTGMTVEMYGANGHNLPASITDPAWKRLHGARVLKKKGVTIKLKTKGAAYRFVSLWITKAPPSSTPAHPGRVAIDELELFPPS
jgi:hypothetical protein